MANVLTKLVDKILGSEAAKLDRMLLEETHESIQTFLHLLSPTISPKLSPDSITPDMYHGLTHLQRAPMPRSSSHDGNWQIQSTSYPPVSSTASHLPAMPESVDSPGFRNNFPVTNVFGNGWAGDLPLPLEPQQQPWLRPNLGASTTLSLEIVQFTLLHAYDALVKARDASDRAVFQTFGLALRYHSKEELLYTLRWFLGPGHQEMYRLGSLDSQQEPIRQANANAFPSHPSAASYHGYWNGAAHFDSADSKKFLSANEVVSTLVSRGAVNIDQNTIKLWVEDTKGVNAEYQDKKFSPSKVNFWDASVFFSLSPSSGLKHLPDSNSPNMQPIYISKPLLVRHLGEISACLLFGPAFREELLQSVIIASVIYR